MKSRPSRNCHSGALKGIAVLGGLLSAYLSLCSCSDGGGHAFVVRDSAGVAIVESVGQGAWTEENGLRIVGEPTVRLGGPRTKEFSFDQVADALVIADSLFIVANRGSGELVFFDSGGDWRYTVGRIGGGPGEFSRLRAIEILPEGHLVAFDSGHRRISVFEVTGELVRTMPLAGALRGGVAMAIGWLESGTFVARTMEPGVDAMPDLGQWRRMDSMAEVLVLDENGLPFGDPIRVPGDQTLSMLTAREGDEYRFISLPNPFLRSFVGAAKGLRVAFGQTTRDEIRILNSDGKMVRVIRRVRRKPELTAGMIDQWIDFRVARLSNGVAKRRRQQQYESMPFPSTLPAFRSVLLDEDGARLWVEEFELDAITSGGETRWSVYAEDGRLLGEVRMPVGFRPLRIGKDYVLGLWRDELDVEYVQLYELGGA